MSRVSTKAATLVLAVLWLLFLMFACAIPLYLATRYGWSSATAIASLEAIAGIYAPHVGAILAFYFASQVSAPHRPATVGPEFIIAFLVSLAWNIPLLILVLRVPFGSLAIEDAVPAAQQLGARLSWLVAPAIGYFFGKAATAEPDAAID